MSDNPRQDLRGSGVQVMLDFELAEIYGYTTTTFNLQVKNIIEKFEGDDFCFYTNTGRIQRNEKLDIKEFDIKLDNLINDFEENIHVE